MKNSTKSRQKTKRRLSFITATAKGHENRFSAEIKGILTLPAVSLSPEVIITHHNDAS
jgi:hypothetical protein